MQRTAKNIVWTCGNMSPDRHFGVSRPLLPPMPWSAFRNLNDDDLEAVFAYLQSIPPVRNRVPEPIVNAFETVD